MYRNIILRGLSDGGGGSRLIESGFSGVVASYSRLDFWSFMYMYTTTT